MKAKPILAFGADIAQLVADMAETMYAAKGVGLAATQVGIPLRLLIMDVSEDSSCLEVFANHSISQFSEEKRLAVEGCLSFPGVYESLVRPVRVKGSAFDIKGEPFSFDREGLAAQCLQHEGEHLDGKVMIDHVSRQKRRSIERFLAKRH